MTEKTPDETRYILALLKVEYYEEKKKKKEYVTIPYTNDEKVTDNESMNVTVDELFSMPAATDLTDADNIKNALSTVAKPIPTDKLTKLKKDKSLITALDATAPGDIIFKFSGGKRNNRGTRRKRKKDAK